MDETAKTTLFASKSVDAPRRVAVVGTREVSDKGIRRTRKLVRNAGGAPVRDRFGAPPAG